jgi:uncharacterized protein YerC
MRVRPKTLSKEDYVQTLDALYTAAGTVKGRAAMKTFLRDLLTESERIMLGRRILIARELIAGRTYDEIAAERKVGKDTIQKIARWLDDQIPGYEQVVNEMEKEFAQRNKTHAERTLYATSAIFRLKKKYPLHFLLFPWPKEYRDHLRKSS